jgi:hypothetical protein
MTKVTTLCSASYDLAASTNEAAKHFDIGRFPSARSVHLEYGKDGWRTEVGTAGGISSPARRKKHFQPARTRCHFLPRVVGTPALSKTYAYGVGVHGPRPGKVPVTSTSCLVGVEDVETVTWRYPIHQKRPRIRII